MIHKSTDISNDNVKIQNKVNTVAFFAGSFNPFTKGHLDIVERCAPLFGKIIIGIGINSNKEIAKESLDIRTASIKKAVGHIPNVGVTVFDCLTVDAAKEAGASVLIRGVRDFTDFEYEKRMAEVNRKLTGIETLLMICTPEYASISSSLVRELESFGYDVTQFLP